MNYLNIGLDSPVSIFDICQAHAQLESDYNMGGIVRERPSNRRRRECIVLRHAACMSYAQDEITELIEKIRANRETLKTEYADYV